MTQTAELSKESKQHLNRFIELAKQCENGQEFYDKARKIKDIPAEFSDWFYSQYALTCDMLGPVEASQDFLDDVNNGVYSGI